MVFAFCSFFFFFPHAFQRQNLAKIFDFSAHQWVTCTVHDTHKLHFSTTFSLKMGSTALFTHLKIILLQCFQFSIFSFSKISSIQTDPKVLANRLKRILPKIITTEHQSAFTKNCLISDNIIRWFYGPKAGYE